MTKRVGLAALILALAVGSAEATSVDLVAIKFGPAPGVGTTYLGFKKPAAGDSTTSPPVAFFARRLGPLAKDKGLFQDEVEPGTGAVVVLKDSLSPNGRLFKRFGGPSINDDGIVAYDARLSGSDRGVFRDGSSVVSLLGDPVPVSVATGGLLNGFSNVSITDDGDVVYLGTISGAGTVGSVAIDQGVFRCTGGDGNCSSGTGTLEAVVMVNDPIPDRPGRDVCGFRETVASNYGVVFLAETKLDCSDGLEFTTRGVFRLSFGGSIETVALEGETADSTTPGTIYGIIASAPDMANDGTVAFRARTTGTIANQIIYACAVGTCPASPASALVVEGTVDQDGNAFKRFSTPGVADGGHIAFKGRARGSSGTVKRLYLRRASGTLETIAEKGGTAPGVSPTSEIKKVFDKIDMSSGGRIAFRAKVKALFPPRKTRDSVYLAEIFPSPSAAFVDYEPSVLD